MHKKEEYRILDLRSLGRKIVCLTLDVEQDFGELLDEPTYEALDYIPNLVKLLEDKGIPLTCFVQGSLLETHAAQIEKLFTLDVEFELHSYSHHKPSELDVEFEIRRGAEAYRGFFRKDPMGYRAPLGVINRENYEILVTHGFKFDSSVFPLLRPGTFNNLSSPTIPYILNTPRIVEFPVTVFSKAIRVPMTLSYIRLLGKPYFWLLRTVELPNLIIFTFHLHDLFRLKSSYRLPGEGVGLIYKNVYKRLYRRAGGSLYTLSQCIEMLRDKGYTFMKLIDVYHSIVAS